MALSPSAKTTPPAGPLLDRATWRVVSALRKLRRKIVREPLEYAPDGWETPLPAGERGWLSAGVLAEERRKWDEFAALTRGPGPLGFSHEAPSLRDVEDLKFHNLNYTFAYVLLKAAFGRERLRVLDWGGGLGYYYLLAKALLPPQVNLEYHCKDVPTLVQAGRELAPEIFWHEDDSCLGQEYDLVMLSGSLQYCREWKSLLASIREAAGGYFFLTRTPTVRSAESFVAVQRAYGARMLHQQFNETELLSEIRQLGFELVREVVAGDLAYIRNAPEDAVLKGWLFQARTEDHRSGVQTGVKARRG
jgi:putative methyltransferase (TIGR04325 family)